MEKILILFLLFILSSCSLKETNQLSTNPSTSIETKIKFLREKNEKFLKILEENTENFIVLKDKENYNLKEYVWIYNKKVIKIKWISSSLLTLKDVKDKESDNLDNYSFWKYIKIKFKETSFYINENEIEFESKINLTELCTMVNLCLKDENKLFELNDNYYVYRYSIWYYLPDSSFFLSDFNLNNNSLKEYSLIEFNENKDCKNFGKCKWFLAKVEYEKIGSKDFFKNVKDLKEFWKLISYEYNFFAKNNIENTLQEIKLKVDSVNWNSEEDKIKNIYDWILNKYTYDWHAANNVEKLWYIAIKDQYAKELASFSWIDVLNKEKWVCQAFSYLFAISLHLAWINQEIKVVSGSAISAPNHAWNKVWNYYFDLTRDILRKEKGKKTLLYYKVQDASFYNTHKIKEL